MDYDEEEWDESDYDEVEWGDTYVIIDNGSASIKAGFCGQEAPVVDFPNMVGRQRHNGAMFGIPQVDAWIGHECHRRRGILSVKRPIQRGIIQNWDDMEKVWRHTFYNELRVAPEEKKVLMTYSPGTSKADKEKMTSAMLNTMDEMFGMYTVRGFLPCNTAICALFASGRTTGIVLDSGAEVTRAVPIHDGHVLSKAVTRLDIGGQHLTQNFTQMLAGRGYAFTTSYERALVKNIKEEVCFVSVDYNSDFYRNDADERVEISYDLPDGQKLKIGNERFRCAEMLFQPHLLTGRLPMGSSAKDGIHTLIHNSIQMTEANLRDDFYSNVVLSGGNANFPYIEERLEKELAVLAPTTANIQIFDPDAEKRKQIEDALGEKFAVNSKEIMEFLPRQRRHNRCYSTWIGGSILASLETSREELCITKDEYDEVGPTIVHRKCF